MKSPYRSEDSCVCVGALGRGLRELRGFTEAAGRVDVQAGGGGREPLKEPSQGRVVCLLQIGPLDTVSPVQHELTLRYSGVISRPRQQVSYSTLKLLGRALHPRS